MNLYLVRKKEKVVKGLSCQAAFVLAATDEDDAIEVSNTHYHQFSKDVTTTVFLIGTADEGITEKGFILHKVGA